MSNNTNETQNSIFFSASSLAEYLGVKPQTIRLWTMNRLLPFYKVNGTAVRYKREEIDTWLKNQKVQEGTR
jgi:excisionase family DNA binding protein